MGVGQKVLDLFNVANYEARIAGYRELNKVAVETGARLATGPGSSRHVSATSARPAAYFALPL